MKITARGSGGFAGRDEHYVIDTARIEQGAALEALLQNLDGLIAAAPAPPVGADIGRWQLTIDDGGQSRQVEFAEDGSAGPWQSVLDHLRRSA